MNATLRREILEALREIDRDDDVRVTIIRGAGKCFCAGYDLSGDPSGARAKPLDYNADGEGSYMRGVTNGWMSIWDLAKPVIAQVHSYCLAGGTELATGCDLVYVAEDAKIGYPAVRFGTPDMQYHAWMFGMRAGMESMLTGDPFTGVEAAQLGWANRAFPEDELEEKVLAIAVAHRADPERPRCRSTSARCTARWRSWGSVSRSARAPSSARWPRTPRRSRSSSPTFRARASPARSPSATPPSATTARRAGRELANLEMTSSA